MLLLLTALFAYSYNSTLKIKEQELFYTSVVEDFYQLSFLSHDIVMYPKEERARVQWREKFQSIKTKLEGWDIVRKNRDKKEKIYKEHMELLKIYNRIVTLYANGGKKIPEDQLEYRKRLIGQMQIRIYDINSDVQQLVKEIRLHMLEQQQYYESLMYSIVIFFSLLISWMSWYLITNILNPLQKLHEGVQMISKGDLSFDIGLNTDDELGDLSKALESMTKDLLSSISHLKELDRLKTLFIASMSHELRTPLNAIIGFSAVLKSEMVGPLNEKQKNQLERIHDAGEHLLSMIVEVLDISKIETKQIPFSPEPFSLKPLIEELIEELEPRALQKGLKLELVSPEDVIITTDRQCMKRVIENYMTNAIKYSTQGTITVSAKMDEKMLEIEVSDKGIGISEEDTEKIFQPFERLDTPMKVLAGGTGLGLYLTKKIAEELMHAEVYVRSTPGKGSTFGVRMHLKQENFTRDRDEDR